MFEFAATMDLQSPIVWEQIVGISESWERPLSKIATAQLSKMSDEELDADWKLDEFFGTIAVINLPQAVERKSTIDQELRSIGTKNHIFFRAIDGRKELGENYWSKFHGNREKLDPSTEEGKQKLELLHKSEAGCYMSHYSVIKHVKEQFDKARVDYASAKRKGNRDALHQAEENLLRFSRVLILEDDSAFGFVNAKRKAATKQGAGVHFRKALQELPEDWDFLYLVVQAMEPTTNVSTRIRKMGSSWSCAAYAVNYTMYEPLIDHLKKIEDPNVNDILPVDTASSFIQHKHRAYAIYPSVAYTHAGVSTISDRNKLKLWQGQPIPKKKKQ